MKTPACLMPPSGEHKCCQCEDTAAKKLGGSQFCIRHYRFYQMISASRSSGKLVPTAEWLEANVPEGMICPCCGQQMAWLLKDGGSTCLTIQHDRNGGLRLICQKCNLRHAKMPGDSFYSLPEGHWRCGRCKEVKPVGDFYRVASTGGVSWCKGCKNGVSSVRYECNKEAILAQTKEYRKANSEALLARGRERYAANREQVRSRQKAHYEANRDAISARRQERYPANRDAIITRRRELYRLKKLAEN